MASQPVSPLSITLDSAEWLACSNSWEVSEIYPSTPSGPTTVFLNRGYHASTSRYYYWTSNDHIDSSGSSWPYGSSPPFSEISDVVGVGKSST